MTTVASNDPRILTVEVTLMTSSRRIWQTAAPSVSLSRGRGVCPRPPQSNGNTLRLSGRGKGSIGPTLMRTSVPSGCSRAHRHLARSTRCDSPDGDQARAKKLCRLKAGRRVRPQSVCRAHTAPNYALEPTAYSFGSAALRLRFRRRLTAGVRLQKAGCLEVNKCTVFCRNIKRNIK